MHSQTRGRRPLCHPAFLGIWGDGENRFPIPPIVPLSMLARRTPHRPDLSRGWPLKSSKANQCSEARRSSFRTRLPVDIKTQGGLPEVQPPATQEFEDRPPDSTTRKPNRSVQGFVRNILWAEDTTPSIAKTLIDVLGLVATRMFHCRTRPRTLCCAVEQVREIREPDFLSFE